MCLGTVLKEVNHGSISCGTFIKHFNRFSFFGEGLKMGISDFNGLCFLLFEILGAATQGIIM